MKAIYSIKQLRHSSNVGGATQHNGWHRATGHIADTVEISKSSRISRPARQVIADQVATSGRSDGQGHHVDYRNAEAPADQLVRARARQSARLGYLMSSTQAIRKRHACIGQPGALWIWKRGAFAARRDDMIRKAGRSPLHPPRIGSPTGCSGRAQMARWLDTGTEAVAGVLRLFHFYRRDGHLLHVALRSHRASGRLIKRIQISRTCHGI